MHLEFVKHCAPLIESVGEDVVVLAGDIGVGTAGIEWARIAFSRREVIYVLGNHEFYDHDWVTLLDAARKAAAGSNVHVLEDAEFKFGDVTFLGATLWTDFAGMGPSTRMMVQMMAPSYMTDYRAIRHANKLPRTNRLIPPDVLKRCISSYRYLDQRIAAETGKLVVVTHNAPTMRTMSPQYQGDLGTALFHNNFEDLIRPPVVAWIHGHSHHNARILVNGIPVVSNQMGYPLEKAEGFDWGYCIDV